MPFDSLVLAAVTREIQEQFVGERLTDVHQPDPLSLSLTLGRGRRLFLSAHPEYASVHLLSRSPGRSPTPPSFCMLLRKWIEGERLRHVRQIEFDRILELEFGAGERTSVLVVELMGRHSNIVLRDPQGFIRGVIKSVSPTMNRYREVTGGKPYVRPPTGNRVSPLEGSAEEAVEKLMEAGDGISLGQTLSSRWIGMSPALIAWFGEQVGLPEDTSASRVFSRPEALREAVERLRETIILGAFAPSVRPVNGPARRDFWALPFPGSISESSDSRSMSAVVESVFDERIAFRETEQLRRQLLASIDSARRREERKLGDFRKVRENAVTVPTWRRWGAAILADVNAVPENSVEALIQDPQPESDDAGELLRVPLDPELSAVENAQRYYERARNTERALRKVKELEPAVIESLEQMEALRGRVIRADSPEALRQITATAQRTPGGISGNVARPSQNGPEGERRPTACETPLPPGVRRVIATSGYEILYGRSATDNDYVTTRIAQPNDLWLHVRGESSAHVIIRTGNHPDRVPRETLLEAANIAAIHSSSKHSSYVAVDYTLRKYVVKRRKSAPGTVEYRGEKTLHIQPGLAS